jgi:hypothetical protein
LVAANADAVRGGGGLDPTADRNARPHPGEQRETMRSEGWTQRTENLLVISGVAGNSIFRLRKPLNWTIRRVEKLNQHLHALIHFPQILNQFLRTLNQKVK